MAAPVVVGSWDATGVRVGRVVAELGALRRGRPRRAARASVMTLVVVASMDDVAAEATRAVHAVIARHPARVLIVRPDPDAAATLDARAELFEVGGAGPPTGAGRDDRPGGDQGPGEGDGAPTTFEQVTLSVGGQAARHLDSLVEPFVQGDLPVAAWFADAVPDATAAGLSSVADTVVVDMEQTGPQPASLRALLELVGHRPVIDLAWLRLEPLRGLVAGLFDPPDVRAFVTGVTRARVAGDPATRYLLGGWLVSQLSLAPRQVELVEVSDAAVRLEAVRAGRVRWFEVGRLPGRGGLRAGCGEAEPAEAGEAGAVGGAPDGLEPATAQTVPLPDTSLRATLASALGRMHRPDPVWARAITAAGTLMG